MKREQEYINKEDLLNDLYSDNPDDILGYIARYKKASYDVLDERERFRHELHDKIGEQEWFGSEEFWVRVRDIEHMAADLHMRYKAESEDKK